MALSIILTCAGSGLLVSDYTGLVIGESKPKEIKPSH
jgi:hypothetical protein